MGRDAGREAPAEGRSDELLALRRAVSVLECLASAPPGGLGLSEIAQACHLAKSSALRVLRTWESLGYATRSEEARYALGWKTFVLARGRSRTQELHQAAHPHLEKVNEQSMETVMLGVLAGHKVVYVDRIEGRQRVRVSTEVGQQQPLYATACGKAILAHQAPAVVEAVMADAVAVTPQTVVSAERMEREIAKVRRDGYAVARGELTPGVGAVAAPIVTSGGKVEAAVSIAFPLAGADEPRITEFGGMALAAARTVSLALGWTEGVPAPPASRAAKRTVERRGVRRGANA